MKKSKNKINYLAIDSYDDKTILAQGPSIKKLIKKVNDLGKDCVISPDLKDDIIYIF